MPEGVVEPLDVTRLAARLTDNPVGALKLSFLTMALLVIVPSRRLPGYVPDKVPSLPAASD